jgi:HAD superfamily hydrolase (TIGR01490 family)
MGKCIIAVFDLDRTLTSERSLEAAFFRYLLKSGKLMAGNLISAFLFFLRNIFKGFYEALKKNKMYLKGVSPELTESWVKEFVKAYGNTLIYSKNFQLVKSHKDIGHTTILISGSPFILVNSLNMNVWFDYIYATHLELVDGVYSGCIDGTHYYGKSKSDLVMRLREELNADLDKSFCYADSIADIAMMRLFGNPVAVNPDRRLRRVALRRHWEIIG